MGQIVSYTRGEISFESAMKGKETSFLEITQSGIIGNEIADKRHHGGANKAVFAYGIEAYAQWEKELGLKIPYGGMGENLLLEGVKESELRAGDRLVFDEEVILEISMPRVQCFKIPSLYPTKEDKNALAKFLFAKGCVGFYLRVLRGGIISKNASISIQPSQDSISLQFAHRIYQNPNANQEGVGVLLANPKLAQEFKRNVEERLEAQESSLLDWQVAK